MNVQPLVVAVKDARVRMLCDGCDRSRRWVKSLDGRTLVCVRCRWKWRWLKLTGEME